MCSLYCRVWLAARVLLYDTPPNIDSSYPVRHQYARSIHGCMSSVLKHPLSAMVRPGNSLQSGTVAGSRCHNEVLCHDDISVSRSDIEGYRISTSLRIIHRI